MNTNFYVKRSEYVEIDIPSNNLNQTVYFPDLPNLRNTKTWGLSAYMLDTVGKSQSGLDLPLTADWKATIVFLYFDNGLFIAQPIMSFANVNLNNYFQLPTMLAGQNIVWSKSYIQLLNTVSNYQSKAFVFNVYYSLR